METPSGLNQADCIKTDLGSLRFPGEYQLGFSENNLTAFEMERLINLAPAMSVVYDWKRYKIANSSFEHGKIAYFLAVSGYSAIEANYEIDGGKFRHLFQAEKQ